MRKPAILMEVILWIEPVFINMTVYEIPVFLKHWFPSDSVLLSPVDQNVYMKQNVPLLIISRL